MQLRGVFQSLIMKRGELHETSYCIYCTFSGTAPWCIGSLTLLQLKITKT